MTIAKLLQNFDEVTAQDLRATDDYDKYLKILIDLAEKKSGEIKPTASCREFKNCVTANRGKLMLWYNDKTGNTKLVEVRPE
jgi:hypothetical protein